MFQPGGPTFFELLHQALVSTERGYDLLAPKFERTPFRTPDPVISKLASEIGERESVDVALDLCCGTGAVMRHLRPLCRERVIGLDFSAGMLAEARAQLATAEGSAAIEPVQGDALAIQFDREIDVVTSAGAFGHVLVRDEDRFVAGIARALRPGGRFVFATSTMPSWRESSYWIARGFNAAMRVRNALIKPEFIMYYLTFLWPAVRPRLEAHGLEVVRTTACPAPYTRGVVVTARKR